MWKIMTRITGPDCAVMYNLINTQTHNNLIAKSSPWPQGRKTSSGRKTYNLLSIQKGNGYIILGKTISPKKQKIN